jgi:hypothetical protein
MPKINACLHNMQTLRAAHNMQALRAAHNMHSHNIHTPLQLLKFFHSRYLLQRFIFVFLRRVEIQVVHSSGDLSVKH